MTVRKLAVCICCLCLLTVAAPALAQGASDDAPAWGQAVRSGETPAALRDLPVKPAGPPKLPFEIPNKVRFQPPRAGETGSGPDPLVEVTVGPTTSALTTPGPLLSFDGTSDDDNAAVVGGRVVPPDTNGDVGPNHYIQMNNLVFEIFDKSGTSVFGPAAGNTLWQGFGGICETNNDGDPIVLYDQGADRWVFSQFAIGASGHQCFAVSQTNDPLGAYWLYDFVISPNCFNDYPKIGVWPDGYYLTANEFCGSFRSAIAVAFEKPAMLTGAAADFVVHDIASSAQATYFGVQPSHWEGPTAPPTGAPNTYVMSFDDGVWGTGGGPDGYQLWEFAVDWSTTSSTFTPAGFVTSANFDANLCNFGGCIQQSGGELLDTLSQFTMYRATYRNFGSHEVLLVSHSVDVGSNRAGTRFAELRDTGAGYGLHQEGTFAPNDGLSRWMGSVSMDGSGNIALAYSVSSSGIFPEIRYTARESTDPLGTVTGGEQTCIAGAGSQIASSNRWGDYSSISVDPVDDCTFWLTNEYYANTGSFDFKTRVCAFKLDECGACEVTEDAEMTCDDGIDNDCDGAIDADDTDCCPDADGDGFNDAACGGADCNDNDPAINPGASEQCTDAVDNDCDLAIDCADPDCDSDPACCPDADGDGFTDAACGGTDCNDGDPAINPLANEICTDTVDNDCDGLFDCDDDDCDLDPVCDVCGPKGASCVVDADCCSNKCRGPSGNMTCKGN